MNWSRTLNFSVVLIVVMFGFPALLVPILLPRLTDPVPRYEQIILSVVFFCAHWKWDAIPIAAVLFIVAGLTKPHTSR